MDLGSLPSNLGRENFCRLGHSIRGGTGIAKVGRRDSDAMAFEMDRRNRNLRLPPLQTQSPDQALPQLFRTFLRFKRPDSVRVTNLEAFVTHAVFTFSTPNGCSSRIASAAFRRSFSQHSPRHFATAVPVGLVLKNVPPFIARTDSRRFVSC